MPTPRLQLPLPLPRPRRANVRRLLASLLPALALAHALRSGAVRL